MKTSKTRKFTSYGTLKKDTVEELLTTINDVLKEGAELLPAESRRVLAALFVTQAKALHEETGGHFTEGSPIGVKVRTLTTFADTLKGE